MNEPLKVGNLVRYIGKNPRNRPRIYGWIGKIIDFTYSDFDALVAVVTPPLPGGDLTNLEGTVRYQADWVNPKSLKRIDDPKDDEHDERDILVKIPQESFIIHP